MGLFRSIGRVCLCIGARSRLVGRRGWHCMLVGVGEVEEGNDRTRSRRRRI